MSTFLKILYVLDKYSNHGFYSCPTCRIRLHGGSQGYLARNSPLSQDPTVGFSLGPYGGPTEGAVSHGRGTPVWQGFSQGLMNSMVALPMISAGVINPMTKLKGALNVYPKPERCCRWPPKASKVLSMSTQRQLQMSNI